MRIFAISLLIFLAFQSVGQCVFSNNSFKANEEISYEFYYNWGFIWVNAGMAVFTTTDTLYKEKKVIKLNSFGRSHKKYDWFYKVRDYFESIIDTETVLPYRFSRQTREGDFEVDNHYTFNQHNVIASTENSESFRKIDTISKPECTLDVLSVIYACRSINFNNRKINDTIPLSMIVDGEIFNLYIRYKGTETIVNKDMRQFDCNKFSVMLVEGTIFKGGEDMFVWVTNDKNQIPVYIEAKILVGSIKAMVNDIKNTKWPANYKVFSDEIR